MTMVENGVEEVKKCIKSLHSPMKLSHTIGVTGWPGAGKSTIVSGIAKLYLDRGKEVGIIAIDPTSPISGGSFLGDRERMREIDGNERLFIRSMATRGHSGGIAPTTYAFIKIMEAMGKEIVIIETVGVGQDQVYVTNLVDTVLMVVMPGMGDYLQALKAGIMELGDIFVVNKADRKGTEEMIMDLKITLNMMNRKDGWKPPIVKTIGTEQIGIDEVVSRIDEYREFFIKAGMVPLKRIEAAKMEIYEALKSKILLMINERTDFTNRLDIYAQEVIDGKLDIESLVNKVMRDAGIAFSK